MPPSESQARRCDRCGARLAGYNRSLLVMLVLLALMIGEQALAYSASYHVARPSVR